MNVTPAPTAGYIARFWSPLAATWIMMSPEGPVLAALIARLPDPKVNLAVSGLAPDLAAYAWVPVMLLAPLPALSVWLSYQRAVNVLRHRTKPITVATIVEIAAIALIFAVTGWGLVLVGVTAATIAIPGGRLLSNLYLEVHGETARLRRVRGAG